RPPVPPAPAPPAPAARDARSHNGSDPQQAALPAAAALPQSPSLELRGFSDIDFSGSDQKGTHSGFSEGQFTLHLVSALAPKVNFFSEITLSARRDAGLGGCPGLQSRSGACHRPFRSERCVQSILRPLSHTHQLVEYHLPSWPMAPDDCQPSGNGAVWRPVYSDSFRRRSD